MQTVTRPGRYDFFNLKMAPAPGFATKVLSSLLTWDADSTFEQNTATGSTNGTLVVKQEVPAYKLRLVQLAPSDFDLTKMGGNKLTDMNILFTGAEMVQGYPTPLMVRDFSTWTSPPFSHATGTTVGDDNAADHITVCSMTMVYNITRCQQRGNTTDVVKSDIKSHLLEGQDGGCAKWFVRAGLSPYAMCA